MRKPPLAAVAEENAVIAFGHTGPVTDEGWTWSHDQGMKAVQEAFPKLKTLFVESIPYSADATRTFRQFVSEGANMVFATSNYGDFLYDVAKRSPDVAFYECDGRNPLANLSTYYLAHWYPTYVTGVAAGLMSKSGKLGYVASFPVPSVFSGTNAFLMGARSVNPAATMQTIVINSWFDPQAATQAGTALIDNGADLLFGIMDEAGYLQVAEQRGAKAVMWNTDIRRYGPKAYVSSIVIDFKKYYVDQVRLRLEGKWTPLGNHPADGRRHRPRRLGRDRAAGSRQAGRCRARQDPRRLEPVRRRDQGRQGQCQGGRRQTHDRGGTLQLGLVDRGRQRPLIETVSRGMNAMSEPAARREPESGAPPIVLLKGISKLFPGVVANQDVDLDVMSGEIHALLGENGAGKSTLMNILTGIYQPDAGEIIIDGYAKRFAPPVDAIAAGIGMGPPALQAGKGLHGGREHSSRLVGDA